MWYVNTSELIVREIKVYHRHNINYIFKTELEAYQKLETLLKETLRYCQKKIGILIAESEK